MSKKDYQLFADVISRIKNGKERERVVSLVSGVFARDNERFDEGRFREWIDRRRKGESLRGLNYNPKYTILGV